MSRRSELKRRIHTLGEIKSILGAMKSLSIIEMNKVTRYLGAQTEFAAAIEEALGDFESFFGTAVRPMGGETRIFVLIGSERGFCGGFNEAVLAAFEEAAAQEGSPPKAIVVGRKLASKLEGDPRVTGILDGPSAAEEIAGAIAELARCLARFPSARWTLIHHRNEESNGQVLLVDPFTPRPRASARGGAFPPLLNVAPERLHGSLLEQYLFSILYRAFYQSFFAENRERLRHMEGALSSVDREWGRMRRLGNVLRQDEITEELEIIMLSVTS